MKIKDAEAWTGKSRSTLLRAVKNGKVSAKKDEGGAWDIDAADLARVFEMKTPAPGGGEQVMTPVHDASRTGQMNRGEQAMTTPSVTENNVLRAQLDAAQQMADERGKTIEHLRSELAEEKEERRAAQTKLTALLTDQRVTAPEEAAQPPRTRPVFWVALAVALAALAGLAVYLRPAISLG